MLGQSREDVATRKSYMDTLADVRCRGCRKRMGVGHGHPQQKLFCSSICAVDYPVFDNTERDDVIEILVRTRGWDAIRIAMELGLSRQRAYQILNSRSLNGSQS